jgi:prepilin peptidase CpaA
LTGHKIYFSSAILSLVIGGVIWYLRFAGAGDIKLIAILSLVIVPELFLDILPVFAVSTLGLLLAMYSSDRFFNTKTLTKGIPMGIPISIAGMVGVFASLY